MKKLNLLFAFILSSFLGFSQNGVYIFGDVANAPDFSLEVTFSINTEPETNLVALVNDDGQIPIFYSDLPSDWTTITASLITCNGNQQTISQQNSPNNPLIDIYFSLDYCADSLVYGCTDINAINYDPTATVDDGSCIYSDPTLIAFTDSADCLAAFVLQGVTFNEPIEWYFGDGSGPVTAFNTVYHNYGEAGTYEVCAVFPDWNGSLMEACTVVEIADCADPLIYGCTDSTAINYNPLANVDDGSCEYESEVENDLCANATPLQIGTNIVNNIGAYQNENIWGECWGFGQGEGEQTSVWYSFTTPEEPASISIVAYGDGSYSLTDTQFGLYEECGEDMLFCDGNSGEGLFSAFYFECGDLQEDTDYILMIDGWNGDMGTCYLDYQVSSDCSEDVYGCTDSSAINYNPAATIDDGSCIFNDTCSAYIVNTSPNCNTFILCAYLENTGLLIPGSWSVNGAPYDDWNSIVTFVFDEPGDYEICFWSETEECPFGVQTCEVYTVEPGCLEICPEMWIESDPNGCGAWHYIEGAGPLEEFIWYFGDGESTTAATGVYHNYGEPGFYKACIAYEPNDFCQAEEICAYVEINGCEGEVYGCTDSTAVNYNPLATIDDGSCQYFDSCFVYLIADQITCNQYVFSAWSELGNELPYGLWTVNQEVVDEFSPFFTFEADEPGTYVICFEGYQDNCDFGIFECYTIVVEPDCFSDCPSIYGYLEQPCTGVFELENVPPGETVAWFIDGEGPIYMTSTIYQDFVTDGWHTICAVYDTDECDVVEFCTEVYTQGCEPILGCTDPEAMNYNPLATIDDGSCEYIEDCEDNIVSITIDTQNWGYEISWDLVLNDEIVASGSGYESQMATTSLHCLPNGCYDLFMYDSYGDGWNGGAYSIEIDGVLITYGTLENGFSGVDEFGINSEDCVTNVYGCTDPNAINYNPDATVDDGSCEYENGCDGTVATLLINNNTVESGYWVLSEGNMVIASDTIYESWHDDTICLEDGCYTLTFWMDPDSEEEQNFFTLWLGEDVLGGNDWLHPGISTYEISVGGGCDSTEVYGCTDPLAANYNPQATIDDGSCYYEFDCDVSFAVYPDSTGNNTIWIVPDVNLWTAESVFWDFGDGNTSTELFPQHTYDGDGPYTLCVTVLFSQPDGAFCEVTYCVVLTADMLDFDGLTGGFTINVIENEDVLSIQDGTDVFANMELWPNPTNNLVNLSFYSTNNGNIKLSIIDVSGKIVLQEQLGSQVGEINKQVDIRSLAPGIYVASLQNEFGIATARFVVSR